MDDLKAKLAAQEVDLKQKNEDADKLIQVVGVETEKVSREKAVADEEEQKVASIAEVVGRKQRDCETDLAKAEPALIAAQEALNTLNKVKHTTQLIFLQYIYCYIGHGVIIGTVLLSKLTDTVLWSWCLPKCTKVFYSSYTTAGCFIN